MIDMLTNLIKTQNITFTNTLNRQQDTFNNLQTELDNIKKTHDRKNDAVMTLGDGHFKLLDEKLDNLGGKLLRTTIDMMTQAEAKDRMMKSSPTKTQQTQKEKQGPGRRERRTQGPRA